MNKVLFPILALILTSLFLPARQVTIEGIGKLSFETAFTLSVGSEVAYASPDWLSGWAYRRAISLSPATSVADYQVLVTLTTSIMGNPYANVKADGSDIRFTGADETTLQDYWIESWSNTGTSKIWVKVKTSGASTIYMYYGNSGAISASNGDATFDFFDDFEDGNISDWSQYGSGTVQIANDGGNYVLLKAANNDPNGGYSLFNNGALSSFEAVFRTKRINENGGAQNRYGIENSSFSGYGPRMRDFNSLPSAFAIERRTGGAGSDLASKNTSAYQWNTWMTVKFRRYGNTVEFELYNSSGSLVESISTSNSLYNSFDRFVVHGGYQYYTDDIRVRKYASPEPSATVGSEATPLTVTASANPNPTKVGHQVAFNCTHSGGVGPYTYDWDFGDGTAHGNTQGVNHTYSSSGTPTVTVTVTDSLLNTDNATINMTVNPPLSVTCSANPNPALVGYAVSFRCAPSGGVLPYTYSWDFGDSHRSTDQNPKHTYTAAGVFGAQVTVTDSLGNTATCSKDVRVGLATPTAASRVAPTPPRRLSPSRMSVQYLSINPEQATANQPVTITTNVVNTGDEAGNYNVVLKINGQVEQTRMVSIGPQGTQPIKFTIIKTQLGTYIVDVGGQKGSFTVIGAGGSSAATSTFGGLIAILIVGFLVIVVSMLLILNFRRRAY